MPVFFNVLPPAEARAMLLEHAGQLGRSETIRTVDALDRVTARRLSAPHPLPIFRRGTMDGYAVRAADTFGASSTLPALVSIVGEVDMGSPASIDLGAGEAAVIHTGGELPPSADAVVQVENTQVVGVDEVEIVRSVAVGENVIQIGEDIEIGATVLGKGHWLRPQDIGGLLALGISHVKVVSKPRVGIIATGDELVGPDEELSAGQIRDINSYTVASQTTRAGGSPLLYGIVKDDLAALENAAERAKREADLIVFSAGSSVSVRDSTARVISGLGKPGILFHGVAVRPGKPTIGALVDGTIAIGLPGNPVSAMNLYDLLVVPLIHRLLGCQDPPRRPVQGARLARNIPATPGREDHVAVRLTQSRSEWWAEPVFGKSNLIYTLVNADGTVIVPLDSAGLLAGELVDVRLFH